MVSEAGATIRGHDRFSSFRSVWIFFWFDPAPLHSGKSLIFPKTSVTIVILFWLKWAGYLAVAGLNVLAQLSDRRSPYGV